MLPLTARSPGTTPCEEKQEPNDIGRRKKNLKKGKNIKLKSRQVKHHRFASKKEVFDSTTEKGGKSYNKAP